VLRRQFCTMAREFGFASATDFALVVESWTQEQRRNCLDAFYRRREARLAELATTDDEGDGDAKDEGPVKSEGGQEDVRVVKVKEEEMDHDGGGWPEPKIDDDHDGAVKQEDVEAEASGVKIKTEVMPERKVSSIFLYDDEETDEL